MKITEYRAYEILCWLDDQAGDHTNLFDEMTLYRDAASLIRQLRDAEQSAWHAGLDAGRELGRGKERADAMAGEAFKHEDRAERLAEALRMVAALKERESDELGDAVGIARDALAGEQEVDNG